VGLLLFHVRAVCLSSCSAEGGVKGDMEVRTLASCATYVSCLVCLEGVIGALHLSDVAGGFSVGLKFTNIFRECQLYIFGLEE
jgi:hypothetical protein